MIISFTGHRNRTVHDDTLTDIMRGCDLVIHGGAIGFDSQVAAVAQSLKIPQIIVRPDYKKYGKRAPLIRNKQIVNRCDHLIACYDGRSTGGTKYTINYAKHTNKPIKILPPV